jgi:ribosomal protein S18 acetylase RimI-like enzyme
VSQAPAARFRSLSQDRNAGLWIPQVLPWVREAGEPYYSWLFGRIVPADRLEPILAGWMRRRSSEVSVERAVLLMIGDRAVGGFIGLGGTDLQTCRRADTLAALQAAGRDGWSLLAERIRQGQDLFAPVAANEFYLSKLWVATGSRGAGHGVRILEEYLRTGMAQGFRRFRLDVWTENRPAVELYRAFGFDVLRESSNDRAGIVYLSMALELRENDFYADRGQAR